MHAGSSPLTRGARNGTRRRCFPSRLIPAHAGSTWSQVQQIAGMRAHPRSRGEHKSKAKAPVFRVGSSPLTRGAPVATVSRSPGVRLIPAHAGSTPTPVTLDKGCEAHPRSRGEHAGGSLIDELRKGSSPLTRGALQPTINTPTKGRLIPAHAGSTVAEGAGSFLSEAHPRSRGEHFSLVTSG